MNGELKKNNCEEEIVKTFRNWSGTYYKASHTFYVEKIWLNATQLLCSDEEQNEWNSSYGYKKDNDFYSAIVLKNFSIKLCTSAQQTFQVTCQKTNGKLKCSKYLTSSNMSYDLRITQY